MSAVFLIVSWIAIGYKWGLGAAIAALFIRLIFSKPRWNSSVTYLLFLYGINVATWVFGVIAVTNLLGETWGAVMALIIAIGEIVAWYSK